MTNALWLKHSENFISFSDHALFKIWAQLESKTKGNQILNAGLIQLDLSIISMMDPPAPVVVKAEDYDATDKYYISKNLYGVFGYHDNPLKLFSVTNWLWKVLLKLRLNLDMLSRFIPVVLT